MWKHCLAVSALLLAVCLQGQAEFDTALAEDGTPPDYIAQLNGKMSEGVTNDSNAFVGLLSVYDTEDWHPRHPEGLERELGLKLDELPKQRLWWVTDWAEEHRAETIDKNKHQALESAVSDMAWNVEQAEILRAWLDDQATALAAVEAAAQRDHYYAPLIRSGPGESAINLLLPNLGANRMAARVLRTRALLALEANNLDAALDDIETLRRLADHVRSEPLLISNLVAVSIDGIAAQVSTAFLEDGVPTAVQAQRLAELMPERAGGLRVAETIDLGERLFGQDIVDLPRRKASGEAGEDIADATLGPMLRLMCSPLMDRDHAIAQFNAYYDEAVAVANAPTLTEAIALGQAMEQRMERSRPQAWIMALQAMAAAAEAVEAQGAALSSNTQDNGAKPAEAEPGKVQRQAFTEILVDALASIMIPATSAAVKTEHLSDTQRGLIRVGAELARHHAQHGRYPENLDVIADGDINIPKDLDGQPLRYRRLQDGGYELYSIGQNLQDDDGLDDRSHGDLVIRVTP